MFVTQRFPSSSWEDYYTAFQLMTGPKNTTKGLDFEDFQPFGN